MSNSRYLTETELFFYHLSRYKLASIYVLAFTAVDGLFEPITADQYVTDSQTHL